MSDVLDKLKEWSNTPFDGDPMIDTLLNDVSLAAEYIETLEARIAELEAIVADS